MSLAWRDLKVREAGRLLGLFIVAFVIGLAIRTLYPARWPIPDAWQAVGDTLIVVGVIGGLIEIFSAKLLIERVARDLAERMVGRGLPKQLQAKIREIVETQFVRDHYEVSYSFSDPEDRWFHIDIGISFDVKNYSHSARDYPLELAEEGLYEPEFQRLEYRIAGGESQSFGREQLERNGYVVTDPDTNVKRVKGPTIKLEPVTENGAPVCQVTWRYRVKMRDEYSAVVSFFQATLGPKIRVERIPDGLEFTAGGQGVRPPLRRSWYFDRPFIEGQHVRVWWFPSRADGSATISRALRS